jgi:flagellar export protein FliJ
MTRKGTVSKVLELKGFEQEQLEAEVKKTNDRLKTEMAKLEDLEKRSIDMEGKFKSGQEGGRLDIAAVGLFYDYLSYLDRQIEEQKRVVFRLYAEFERRKNDMIEAYKEKKIFEKFRDKIVHEDDRQALIVEQNEADYNYISKRLRK